MNKLQEFDERIASLNNQVSEANGAFKTYTAKLKELGLNNVKEADKHILKLEEELKDVQKQKQILEIEIDDSLTEIEDKL